MKKLIKHKWMLEGFKVSRCEHCNLIKETYPVTVFKFDGKISFTDPGCRRIFLSQPKYRNT